MRYTLAMGFVGVVGIAGAFQGAAGAGARDGTAERSDDRPARGVARIAPVDGSRGAVRLVEERRPGTTREERRCGARRADGDRRDGRAMRRLVHGELTVQVADGEFVTRVVDAGRVTEVNGDTRMLTIRRLDGELVTATAGDQTRICKDGEPASFGDIERGDWARIGQVTRGDETRVRGIMVRTQTEAPDA